MNTPLYTEEKYCSLPLFGICLMDNTLGILVVMDGKKAVIVGLPVHKHIFPTLHCSLLWVYSMVQYSTVYCFFL